MFLEFSSVKRVENWIASLSCYERKKRVITYHHCTIENLGTKVETLRKKKKKKDCSK